MSPKRLLLTALLAATVAAAPAEASTVDAPAKGGATVSAMADAATQWPVAGASVQTALTIAQRTWGVPACPQGGGFVLAWKTGMEENHNALASWSGDRDQPFSMVNCEIALNPTVGWDWQKLCTVVVHEVGHLVGKRHVEDSEDVMSPVYEQPAAACLVPDPQAKVAAVARAKTRTKAATRTAKAAKAARRTARAAKA